MPALGPFTLLRPPYPFVPSLRDRSVRSPSSHNAYFVDLFVRVSNKVAITMYTKFGYTVYRKVLGYYSGTKSEDAFGT